MAAVTGGPSKHRHFGSGHGYCYVNLRSRRAITIPDEIRATERHRRRIIARVCFHARRVYRVLSPYSRPERARWSAAAGRGVIAFPATNYVASSAKRERDDGIKRIQSEIRDLRTMWYKTQRGAQTVR